MDKLLFLSSAKVKKRDGEISKVPSLSGSDPKLDITPAPTQNKSHIGLQVQGSGI